MAISVMSVNAGPLGRRFIAICETCNTKLPGRYADREQAEQVGSAHENDRHLARLMERLRRESE